VRGWIEVGWYTYTSKEGNADRCHTESTTVTMFAKECDEIGSRRGTAWRERGMQNSKGVRGMCGQGRVTVTQRLRIKASVRACVSE
jgi:translation elongation factor EF-Tu-like GTPase